MASPENEPDRKPPRQAEAGSRINFATWVVTALVAAFALAGGGYWLASQPNPPEIELAIPTPVPPGPVVVQVDGAVRSPGVYALAPDARVGDAIEAAGGASLAADLDGVNRAARLADGQRLIVPAQQRPDALATVLAADFPVDLGGLVDLNSATVAQLQTLPGIGEVRAQAIVDWRNTNGPFTSVDDLLAIPGIGPATVDDLRGLVAP